MKNICLIFFVIICFIGNSQEQLLSFSSISNKTLLLKLDEGEKDFSNFTAYYIYDAPNATYYGTIDEQEALKTTNFLISSTDDANYIVPKNPVVNYFKAKEQTGLFEYYIYLELPNTMISGATYQLNISNLNTERSTYSFVFDEFNTVSESIHVNQIGVIAEAREKYAYVSQWLGKNDNLVSNSEDFSSLEGANCHVVRTTEKSNCLHRPFNF